MLLLSKLYTTIIYWLHRDELIGKTLVKSAYPCSFGLKGVITVLHLCVFVGSWSRNTSSRVYLFLIGYSRLDCNCFFSWSRCSFSMTVGSWICHDVVVESRPGHPIKLTLLMAFAKKIKVGIKHMACRYWASYFLGLFMYNWISLLKILNCWRWRDWGI